MINRSICTSRKVNALQTDQARLLFTWLILHADDEGRLDGHPDTVKMTVVPGLCWTPSDIKIYLQDLNQTNLIEYYGAGDRLFIQINKWREFQAFHGIRLAPSEIPNPPTIQGDKPDSNKLVSLNTTLLPPNTIHETIPCLSKEKLREVKRSKEVLKDIAPNETKLRSGAVIPVIDFSFTERKFQNITETDMAEWREAYPACDIDGELKVAALWLVSNPEKKKKKYRRFITNWLTRKQEKGGGNTFTKKAEKKKLELL